MTLNEMETEELKKYALSIGYEVDLGSPGHTDKFDYYVVRPYNRDDDSKHLCRVIGIRCVGRETYEFQRLDTTALRIKETDRGDGVPQLTDENLRDFEDVESIRQYLVKFKKAFDAIEKVRSELFNEITNLQAVANGRIDSILQGFRVCP